MGRPFACENMVAVDDKPYPSFIDGIGNQDVSVDHLQPFRPRKTISLPTARHDGWQLKRYAVIADDQVFAQDIASAATAAAIKRLPRAGSLTDQAGNHGVGFQVVHFAETAVVTPVFYWQWGSVLARLDQLRAKWDAPTQFLDGVNEVVGCVWEMDVVNFEINAWKATLLSNGGTPADRLATYLGRWLA